MRKHFHLLDADFDPKKNYFFKEIKAEKFEEIASFMHEYFKKGETHKDHLEKYFNGLPAMPKFTKNLERLQAKLKEVAENYTAQENFFKLYTFFAEFIQDKYYSRRPIICKTLFFPSKESEATLVSTLRTSMKTLDICVFTITNDKLAQAILECNERGVKVRIITDDVKSTELGSDIDKFKNAGIEVKIDKSEQYHMHNKFAIIDSAVVLTGSYNWTVSASNNNQENILIIESKGVVNNYESEFNKLWGSNQFMNY